MLSNLGGGENMKNKVLKGLFLYFQVTFHFKSDLQFPKVPLKVSTDQEGYLDINAVNF